MIADMAVYFGLFWNAFIAATLLPALSEITLGALLANNVGAPFLLWLAATTGNVSGSLINWWLGKHLIKYKDRNWFPFKEDHIAQGEKYFNRYGKWSLLFAWVPIIGDPLTLVAGILNTRLSTFLLLVTIGKSIRYGMIVIAFSLAHG